VRGWIPAFTGMTEEKEGMTEKKNRNNKETLNGGSKKR
jgi:hypothetical protein